MKQLPGAGFDKFEVIPARGARPVVGGSAAQDAAPVGAVKPIAYRSQPAACNAAASRRAQQALLAKAIAAKGGLAELQADSDRAGRRHDDGAVDRQGDRHVPDRDLDRVSGPVSCRRATCRGGKVAQVYADGRYWIAERRGCSEAPLEARGPIQASIQRDIVPLLLRRPSGQLVVREVDSDEPSLAAVEVSGDGMSPLTLFINRDNGLIERARYVARPRRRSEEAYSDYRNVNGVQVPFHTVVRRAGSRRLERDMKTMRFNVPLPAGLFAKPS